MARKPKKVSVVSNSKPEAEQLSDRQRRILQVIRDAVVLRGYPPSIREIGDAAGLQSTSSVAYQLKELERKGFLRRDPNKPRAVDVRAIPGEELKKTTTTGKGRKAPTATIAGQSTVEAANTSYVPLVGSIAAGNPILAEQNISLYYPLPQEIVGDGELFMLQVVGESMRDAGIFDGDWVVLRSQKVVDKGDFVAAMIDGEATVKEFHQDQSGMWLLPHNDSFDPITVAPETEIIGKVVSVMRKL